MLAQFAKKPPWLVEKCREFAGRARESGPAFFAPLCELFALFAVKALQQLPTA